MKQPDCCNFDVSRARRGKPDQILLQASDPTVAVGRTEIKRATKADSLCAPADSNAKADLSCKGRCMVLYS